MSKYKKIRGNIINRGSVENFVEMWINMLLNNNFRHLKIILIF